MKRLPQASQFLCQEARALLSRLDMVKPFSLTMPGVMAAKVPEGAWLAIEAHLAQQQRNLRRQVLAFLKWLVSPAGGRATPADQQRRLTLLRLRFNATLDQLDIFADVLTQRAEHETGIWLAGLDAVAEDALSLYGRYYERPPLVTYLDRGHGAAIRRARTRLPGGAKNPVAIIRVPRERMIGSCGIGSSLVHEVGHQGSALLGLIPSLRRVLGKRMRSSGPQARVWELWDRWTSEVWADYWAMSKLGVAATLGMIAVLSLPRAFVFRINLDDPHPFPYIRVKLSCAVGRALYPDPQWRRLAALWDSFYPAAGLPPAKRQLIQLLEQSLPTFVQILVNHRPEKLKGKSLREIMPVAERQPARLRALNRMWRASRDEIGRAPPTLAFAVLGQASADRASDHERESRVLAQLLTRWALGKDIGTAAMSRLHDDAA